MKTSDRSAWLRSLMHVGVVVGATALLTGTAFAVANSKQDAFAAENTAAMNRMMAAMAIHPSRDIDADFAAMMIPHHQGAIDMAVAELRYGTNEQLRRIAQEIIVQQRQEIDAMHLALNQSPTPSGPSPTQAVPDAAMGAMSQPVHPHSHEH